MEMVECNDMYLSSLEIYKKKKYKSNQTVFEFDISSLELNAVVDIKLFETIVDSCYESFMPRIPRRNRIEKSEIKKSIACDLALYCFLTYPKMLGGKNENGEIPFGKVGVDRNRLIKSINLINQFCMYSISNLEGTGVIRRYLVHMEEILEKNFDYDYIYNEYVKCLQLFMQDITGSRSMDCINSLRSINSRYFLNII